MNIKDHIINCFALFFVFINYANFNYAKAEIKIENIANSSQNQSVSSSTNPNSQNPLAIIDINGQDQYLSNNTSVIKNSNSNNFGISLALGKRFYPNIINRNSKISSGIEFTGVGKNFILIEYFFTKNLFLTQNGEINWMRGFKFGVGHNFKKFNLIFSLNNNKINLGYDSAGTDFINPNSLQNYGISCGYFLTKFLDLRLNLISSLNNKIKSNQYHQGFVFNNIDLGLAYNF